MQQIKFDLIYISERELEIESDYLETVEYLKNITDDEFDTLKAEFLEAYLKTRKSNFNIQKSKFF